MLPLLALALGTTWFAPAFDPLSTPASTAPTEAQTSTRRAPVLARVRAFEEARAESKLAVPAGFYVAFDPTLTFAYATLACDDDGDYVLVVSDALLVAAAYASTGTTTARAFESALARTPRADVMPPPGLSPSYRDGSSGSDAQIRARYTQIVDAVVLRELELLPRSHGDSDSALRCPSPTFTREAGDSVWTPQERVAALMNAPRIHAHARPTSMPTVWLRLVESARDTRYFEHYASWTLANTGPSRTPQ